MRRLSPPAHARLPLALLLLALATTATAFFIPQPRLVPGSRASSGPPAPLTSSARGGINSPLWSRASCVALRSTASATADHAATAASEEAEGGGLSGVLGRGPNRIRRRDLALGALLALLATLAAVAVPLGYGNVVDVLLLPAELSYEQRRLKLVQALQLLGVIYSAEPLFTFFYVRHMTGLAARGVANLKAAFFRRLLAKPMAFFDRTGPSEAVNLLAQDLSGLKDIFFANVQRDRGLRAVGEALFGVVLLFKMQPQLASVFALVIPTVATITARLGQRLIKASIKESATLGRENALALEVVRNIREVRSFGTEDKEWRRYRTRLDDTASNSKEAGWSRGLMESCARAAVYFSIFMVAALGGVLSQRGLMPASSLVSAIGYSFSLNFAVQGINYSYADFKRASAMAKRVADFLSPTASSSSAAEQQADEDVLRSHHNRPTQGGGVVLPPERVKGLVRYEGVEFSYPNRPDMSVLRGVDLTLQPGTVTAIVGPSGAGKSTMAQLLVGFYRPTSGRVTMDGVELSSLSKDTLTREVAFVGQAPNIFTGTIRDNIAYGADTASSKHHHQDEDLEARVLEAARRANALEFILSFPQGLDTPIGDGGVQLSGGQRQRIAIARALLKDSKVLILDEATSALDAESEALVQGALENLMQGRTTLVIAHRLGTVVKADKIVVLRKGQVVETGRHADLMSPSAKGYYRQLMATQQTAYIAE